MGRAKLALRLLAVGAVVAAPLVLGGAVPAAAAPMSGYTCTGTSPTTPGAIPTGTYSSLTVPPGTFCAVEGTVTVQRPVTLGTGSGLEVISGSLMTNGPFVVGPGAVFFAPTNTVPVTFNGRVSVGTGSVFVLGEETPYGAVFASIGGPVTGTDASAVQIHNTAVAGPVRLFGGGGFNSIAGPGFNDLEDNTIAGGVTETGYGGIWAGVIRNVIGGPFTFSNNTQAAAYSPTPVDEYDIGSNFIEGPATCNTNDPAPNVGHSRGGLSIVLGPVRGNQAATCTGVETGITGPPV